MKINMNNENFLFKIKKRSKGQDNLQIMFFTLLLMSNINLYLNYQVESFTMAKLIVIK